MNRITEWRQWGPRCGAFTMKWSLKGGAIYFEVVSSGGERILAYLSEEELTEFSDAATVAASEAKRKQSDE